MQWLVCCKHAWGAPTLYVPAACTGELPGSMCLQHALGRSQAPTGATGQHRRSCTMQCMHAGLAPQIGCQLMRTMHCMPL
jgi:hypothetical protein